VKLVSLLLFLLRPVESYSIRPSPIPPTSPISPIPNFPPSHLPTFPLSHLRTFAPSHFSTFPPSHLPTFPPLTTHYSLLQLNLLIPINNFSYYYRLKPGSGNDIHNFFHVICISKNCHSNSHIKNAEHFVRFNLAKFLY